MTETLSPSHTASRWFAVVDGRRVRQLRRQHGLTPAELAGKADIGLSTVTRLERQGQRRCRTRTLARLAAALGQPPAALTASQPPAMQPAEAPAGPGVPRRVLGQHRPHCQGGRKSVVARMQGELQQQQRRDLCGGCP